MAKALVFWTETKTTSIIDCKDIKSNKNSDRAKFSDKKWYDIKIIEKNDDIDYLESLPISTTGELIKVQDDPENARRKRETQKENRLLKHRHNEAIEEINGGLHGKSIFDSDSELDDEIGNKDEDEIRDIDEDESGRESEDMTRERSSKKNKKFPESRKKPPLESPSANGIVDDEVEKEDDGGEVAACRKKPTKRDPPIKSSKSRKNRSKLSPNPCHFCESYAEDAPYDVKVSALTDSFLLHLKNLREEHGKDDLSSSERTLVTGSDIKIDRIKLSGALRFAEGDPKMLTRSLLRILIEDETKLSKMNAPTIPEDIFKAVERYVNTEAKLKTTLSMTEFRRCVTLFCGSLRPKLAKKGVKDGGRKRTGNDGQGNISDDQELQIRKKSKSDQNGELSPVQPTSKARELKSKNMEMDEIPKDGTKKTISTRVNERDSRSASHSSSPSDLSMDERVKNGEDSSDARSESEARQRQTLRAQKLALSMRETEQDSAKIKANEKCVLPEKVVFKTSGESTVKRGHITTESEGQIEQNSQKIDKVGEDSNLKTITLGDEVEKNRVTIRDQKKAGDGRDRAQCYSEKGHESDYNNKKRSRSRERRAKKSKKKHRKRSEEKHKSKRDRSRRRSHVSEKRSRSRSRHRYHR